MVTRREKILSCVDPHTQLGIEIGPLNKPIVTREMGNIRYIDHATTQELKAKYAADPNVDIDQIVNVDYVWGQKSLPDLVASEAPFDYVVASHVIEHVPDFIGWLKEIHAVLKPEGVLALAIPDKRYCFDYHRAPTQLSEMIEAYLNGSRKPTTRQIFEFSASFSHWNDTFVWSPEDRVSQADVVRSYSTVDAWDITRNAHLDQAYHDVHCWAFTPQSFFEIFEKLVEIELIDFRIVSYHETSGCEFMIGLQAMDLNEEKNDRKVIQLESLSLLGQKATQFIFNTEEVKEVIVGPSAKEKLLQSQLQESQETVQRLRKKVKRLRGRLEQSETEVNAMKTSKFWKLRDGWFSFKKLLGHR